ncbi:DUF1853 family protein [Kordia sp.]|uniref:DUF1853 family protein n=1 Tax=Kordia sp. TaxID=1965332 RepID=UPI003D2A0D0D
MNSKHRIASILKANTLTTKITELQTFDVSELELTTHLDFELPTKLRLGHMVEKVVAELIKASTNYKLLHENIQILEEKNTIGELDFILEEIHSNKIIHLELAYKFYLFDPSISENPFYNWIGPNRRDSLKEKLDKLKKKQFPLLFHNATNAKLTDVKVDNVSQQLCLLASLYIPYAYKGKIDSSFQKAVQGYYLNFDTFINLNHSEKTYYLPTKKEWGIDPASNEIWTGFEEIQKEIYNQLQQNHAPLCWRKYKDSYASFFVVWW